MTGKFPSYHTCIRPLVVTFGVCRTTSRLLIDEIRRELGWLEHRNQWDICHINWSAANFVHQQLMVPTFEMCSLVTQIWDDYVPNSRQEPIPKNLLKATYEVDSKCASRCGRLNSLRPLRRAWDMHRTIYFWVFGRFCAKSCCKPLKVVWVLTPLDWLKHLFQPGALIIIS